MKCPECGREFFEGRFCPDCGTLVNSDYVRQNQSNSSSISEEIKKCRDCGHALKETDKFCPNCGANSHLNKEAIGVIFPILKVAQTVPNPKLVQILPNQQ